MIRQGNMLGIEVDILTWDGNEEELRSFPDKVISINDDGTAVIGTRMPGLNRPVYPGDLLIRPRGRADVSSLHLFGSSWWATAFGIASE